MIIKFQHAYGHNMWSIIENAKNVRYSEEGLFTSPAKFIDERRNSWEAASVWHSRGNCAREDTFNYFSFTEGESTLHCLSDGTVYICNDEGKTIHRMNHRPEGGPISDLPVRDMEAEAGLLPRR